MKASKELKASKNAEIFLILLKIIKKVNFFVKKQK